MIIGLSGYARSGKDESANALLGLGFKRVAFADKLRDFLLALNPIVGTDEDNDYWTVSDVIAGYGWDGYKASPYGPEMRQLLQRLGTECGREMLYDTVWVDAALDDYRTGKVKHQVVPDVRFPNEAEAIKELGGYVLRIERPGIDPANAHVSETALDDWNFDAVVVNGSSIESLHRNVQGWALSLSLES